MKTLLVSRRTPAGQSLAVSFVAMGIACTDAHAALERGLSNGVPYAVGGWSVETHQELMSQGHDYSVMLVFAWKDSGQYLADVTVGVRDSHDRELVTLVESGPIVLLGLTPGTYRIEVARNGQSQSRTLTVRPQTRRQAFFYWPRATLSG
jgi:hypothetical protein